MPRVRLGVVLLLPPAIAGEVDGLRRACGDPMLERVAPHITLVPPVNVRVDALPAAFAAVRRTAATASPLTVSVGPAATFLPATPVVYLSVGGDAASSTLPALRDSLRVAPFDRPDPWPFVPHVTLTDGISETRAAAMVDALADYHADAMLDRLHVLQEGSDRVWRPIADAVLAPERIVGRGGIEVALSVSELLDPEAAALFDGALPAAPPEGGRPLVVVARHDGTALAAVVAWTRDDSAAIAAAAATPDGCALGADAHAHAAAVAAAAQRGAHLA